MAVMQQMKMSESIGGLSDFDSMIPQSSKSSVPTQSEIPRPKAEQRQMPNQTQQLKF